MLVVAGQSSPPSEPTERPLHDPSFRKEDEALGSWLAPDDLESPTDRLSLEPSMEGMVVVLRVGPDHLQSRLVLLGEFGHHQSRSFRVVGRRDRDRHGKQEPERIDRHVALSAPDFLASVVSPRRATLRRLDRLAVDARRTRLDLSTRCFEAAHRAEQRPVDRVERPIVSPGGEVLVDGALGGQVVRQHVPLAARSGQVEDRVHDFPQIDRTWPTSLGRRLRLGQQLLDQRPLQVGQIARIRFAGHRALLCARGPAFSAKIDLSGNASFRIASERLAATKSTHEVVPPVADCDAVKRLFDIHAAYKTIQILGQALRNVAGSASKERKEQVIGKIVGLSRRVLGEYLGMFRDDVLPQIIQDIAAAHKEEQPDLVAADLHGEVCRHLYGLSQFVCFSVIKHTTFSVGSENLALTIHRVLESDGTTFSKVLDLSFALERTRRFPKDEAIRLYRDLSRNRFSAGLVRILMAHHMYLYVVPIQDRQAVCQKMDINLLPSVMDRSRKRLFK